MATEPGPGRRAGLRLSSIAIIAALALPGCGASSDEQSQRRNWGAQEDSLPAPESAPDGVTGMPALPGPGAIGPPDDAWPDGRLPDETGDDALAASSAGQAGGIDPAAQQPAPDPLHLTEPQPAALERADQAADEPGLREAAAVIGEYYAALGRRDFARAYRLWSDGGAASSRSPGQFAESFSGTASWSLEILPPERIDPAGAARYIEVPVAVEEVRQDGSRRRQIGAYTLRRVDFGGDSQQRTWRISSADLRQVRP